MKPVAFLSHSSKDKDFARQLAVKLHAQDVEVWLDEEKIRFGDSIPNKISEGLAKSDVILILVSRNFIESSWCRAEYEPLLKKEIEEERVYVIPIRIDEAKVPLLLSRKMYLDFRGGIDDAQLTRLRDEIWDGYSTKQAQHLTGSPKYRYFEGDSILNLTMSRILDEYPVSKLAEEHIAENKTLVDLYHSVDRLIEKFQSLLDEVSRILVKYGGRDLFFPYRASPEERQEVVISNRKMLAISHDMRDIATSLANIIPEQSSLSRHLQAISRICTTISEVEGNVCVKYGLPPEVPSEEYLPSFDKGYRFHQRVAGLPLYSNWHWTSKDDEQLRQLDRYRHDLKAAIANAIDTKS